MTGFARSKLNPPKLPGGHVGRSGLVETLTSWNDGSMVSISAPAGYGKTTLLAEWVGVDPRSTAWVSLDRTDNDPIALISAIATAFGQAQGLESSFWESMSSPSGSVLGRVAPRLARAMSDVDRPYVLVLDDVHAISTAAGQDVVALLVESVPTGSAVALAGRSEPAGLARWRVQHAVLELGAPELSFTRDEAAQLFQRAFDGTVPVGSVDLHARLEGWVAGLQLAVVVARTGSLDGLGGCDRFVADYLRREALDGLTTGDLDFLTRSAVLDELSGEICDGVLGIEGSGARLRDLEAANRFVVPMDRQQSRYRYHAAFRDLLLAELAARDGDRARRELHRHAAEWFEANGLDDDAVGHALQCDDGPWTARLLAKVGQDTVGRGRIATFRQWLDELGRDEVLAYPPLAVLAGWISSLTGDWIGAERWYADVAELSFDGVPSDGSASFASGLAMYRALSVVDGPERMLADAGFALAAEPSWSVWKPTAQLLTAEALLLRGAEGDEEAAFGLLADAAEAGTPLELADTVVFSRSQRALISMDRNDWDSARYEVAEALWLVGTCYMEDYSTSLLAYAAGARLALHEGRVEDANRLVAQAMRSRGAATSAIPSVAVRLRLVLCRTHVAMGEVVTARHLLREVDETMNRRPDLGTLVEEYNRVRDLVASIPGARGRSPLSPAELRVLPYLQTHLSRDEIADRLMVSHNTVGSHTRAIYRKLDATSRSEAVDAARAIGLLGDGL